MFLSAKEYRLCPNIAAVERGHNPGGDVLRGSVVGGNHVVGRGLVFRSAFGYDVVNLFDERFFAGERRALRTLGDALRNRRNRCGQPKHQAIGFEGIQIFRSENNPAAGIDDQMIACFERGARLGFEVSKVVPAVLRHNVRNAFLHPLNDLGVRGDRLPPEPCGEDFCDGAFPGSSIPNQHEIHEKEDSNTRRMTVIGARWPVHNSNCATA